MLNCIEHHCLYPNYLSLVHFYCKLLTVLLALTASFCVTLNYSSRFTEHLSV